MLDTDGGSRWFWFHICVTGKGHSWPGDGYHDLYRGSDLLASTGRKYVRGTQRKVYPTAGILTVAPTGNPRLLINVTQLLILGVHNLEDRSVLEDPISRYRRAELEKALESATKGKRGGQNETLAHVQERWSAIREFQVQSGLRVCADGSSKERPKVLRVCVLPVVPNLVNHL